MLTNISIILLAIGIIVNSLLLTNVHHNCRILREDIRFLYLYESTEEKRVRAEVEQIRQEMKTDFPQPGNKPLTQADIDNMHFERVWIDYGDSGEDGVVLYGKLYAIDTLDGAGFEDLLLDAMGHGGETLDNPTGEYALYRCPPERKGKPE